MPATRRGARVLDLFERYYSRVYCFARRSVDAATAEDIAQEVFVRLLGKSDLEQMTVNVSYLLKIADNLIKRRYQRMVRHEHYLSSARQRGPAGGGTWACAVSHDASHTLRQASGVLTDGEFDAVRLIVCEGMSYQAAARSLSVTVSTINNWKFRGIQKLRYIAGASDGVPGVRDGGVGVRPGGGVGQEARQAGAPGRDRKAG